MCCFLPTAHGLHRFQFAERRRAATVTVGCLAAVATAARAVGCWLVPGVFWFYVSSVPAFCRHETGVNARLTVGFAWCCFFRLFYYNLCITPPGVAPPCASRCFMLHRCCRSRMSNCMQMQLCGGAATDGLGFDYILKRALPGPEAVLPKQRSVAC